MKALCRAEGHNRLWISLGVLFIAPLLVAAGASFAAPPPRDSIVRASVDSGGGDANDSAHYCTISANGRYVVFESDASDLVTDDTNGRKDIFVRDLQTDSTRRVSVDMAGGDANGDSADYSAISADGRLIAFTSYATDLVLSDGNSRADIFVRDMQTGVTQRVSVDVDGNDPNDRSGAPAISADGRYVAFESQATNLVAGDGNAQTDIFVRDRQTGVTQRVSVDVDDNDSDHTSANPSMSADGRYIAFQSFASDLVSDDGDGNWDIFVRDMNTGITRRVSIDATGGDASSGSSYPAISADGRYVAFESLATDLVTGDGNSKKDIFVRDMTAGVTRRVSVDPLGDDVDGDSYSSAISADGRYVAYSSQATNLVTGDGNGLRDVFSCDTRTGLTQRISVDTASGDADAGSYIPAISGDGVLVVFESLASDLVSGDANFKSDVFVRNRLAADVAYAQVEGLNRYETAIAASTNAYPSGAETIVIATGMNWPDALGGAALAGTVEGPLLLTEPGVLPTEVIAEITRLGAKNAYILGGTTAVSGPVEAALNAKLPGTVTRLWGSNRYATANKIADEVIRLRGADFTGDSFVATGVNFPDALGASPLAESLGTPILLADVNATPYLPAKVKTVVILGGTGAVTGATESAIRSALGTQNVSRIGGTTRYDTAAEIADYGVSRGLHWDGAGIATGMQFPDGLSGGTMLGRLNSVLLLTPRASLDSAPRLRLSTHRDDIGTVHFLGGTAALDQAVRNEVAKELE